VWFWFLGAATVIGLPLFPGFWGKLSFVGGALQMGLWGKTGVALLIVATVVESVALLRVGHALWEHADAVEASGDAKATSGDAKATSGEEPAARFSGGVSYWAGALALSAGILWMGLWPSTFTRAFTSTQSAYAGQAPSSVVRSSTDAFAPRRGGQKQDR
jgi:formate hydrogenlyase subunit 3/multisubunit Na+/H+ antiporter MnhD subunit